MCEGEDELTFVDLILCSSMNPPLLTSDLMFIVKLTTPLYKKKPTSGRQRQNIIKRYLGLKKRYRQSHTHQSSNGRDGRVAPSRHILPVQSNRELGPKQTRNCTMLNTSPTPGRTFARSKLYRGVFFLNQCPWKICVHSNERGVVCLAGHCGGMNERNVMVTNVKR
jgi:hypothetical protein